MALTYMSIDGSIDDGDIIVLLLCGDAHNAFFSGEYEVRFVLLKGRKERWTNADENLG